MLSFFFVWLSHFVCRQVFAWKDVMFFSSFFLSFKPPRAFPCSFPFSCGHVWQANSPGTSFVGFEVCCLTGAPVACSGTFQLFPASEVRECEVFLGVSRHVPVTSSATLPATKLQGRRSTQSNWGLAWSSDCEALLLAFRAMHSPATERKESCNA